MHIDSHANLKSAVSVQDQLGRLASLLIRVTTSHSFLQDFIAPHMIS